MKRSKQTKKKTQPKQKTKKHETKDHKEENDSQFQETKPKIRTITFQNGEIVADSHPTIDQQIQSPSPSSSSNSSTFNSYSNSPAFSFPDTSREKSPIDLLNEENQRNIHQLELIQKQIHYLFDENINEIQKEEKKLTNLIVKSHENLSNEYRYSFDCDSVIMNFPYVRKPSNVDSLIKLKKEQDEEMKQTISELNKMFLDCQERLNHIEEMKQQINHSLENYNEYTNQFISIIREKKEDVK